MRSLEAKTFVKNDRLRGWHLEIADGDRCWTAVKVSDLPFSAISGIYGRNDGDAVTKATLLLLSLTNGQLHKRRHVHAGVCGGG